MCVCEREREREREKEIDHHTYCIPILHASPLKSTNSVVRFSALVKIRNPDVQESPNAPIIRISDGFKSRTLVAMGRPL